MPKWKGEVTIFLSLLLGLILLFLYALIQSASIAVDKAYARGEANIAIESVFAEYQIKLLEEFHIFALDGTYESGNYDREKVESRLQYYGLDSLELEVTQLQLLSDEGGAAYEEQIILYMKQKYGITYLEELFDWVDVCVSQRVEGSSLDLELEDRYTYEEEEVDVLDWDDEYLGQLDFLFDQSVLELVLTDNITLSQGVVSLSDLPSVRTLETGVDSYALATENSLLNQMLISEYMLEHFTNASDELEVYQEESYPLQYEVEYILIGKDTDVENLEGVVNQLLLIRTGVNYTCLMQSTVKKAEVSALALTIATAAGYPLLAEALEQALLVGWAYGESIMDVRSLLEGKSIGFIKNEEAWQLSLSNLLTLGSETENQEGADVENGMDYSDYLRVLLYLEDKDNQILRSLDMLEQRMQEACGLEYFQVDTCITQLEIMNKTFLTLGYTYEYPVAFTYQ